jgi:hypothetical protein
MASNNSLEFLNKAKVKLGKIIILELQKKAPKGSYNRLSKSFRVINTGISGVLIFSLYFWVFFVNYGRKSVRGKRMVWFKDPKDDPRVQSDYARKKDDERHLSTQEWQDAADNNQLITKFSVKGIPATHFIEQALEVARPKARGELRGLMAGEVRKMLAKGARSRKIRIQL